MQRAALLFALVCGCGPSLVFPQQGSQWPDAPTLALVHQPRFVITDNLSDKLSYVTVNATPPALLGDVTVGDNPVELEGPHHLTASPDGRYIYFNLSNYVPGTGSGPHGSHGTGTAFGSVVKLDALTQENLGETVVDRSPGDIIRSSDGKTLFVSHYDLLRVQQTLATGGAPDTADSDVAVIDSNTMQRLAMIPVCPTAHGMGLSNDGATLFVTCWASDQLAVVDVHDRAHPKVTTTVSIGPTAGPLGMPSYGPYALAVSPADGSVWISDNNSADVRVFDPSTMAMDGARTVSVGGVAMFASFSQDGSTLYVPHQGDDQLTAVTIATLQARTLPMPPTACLNVHAFVLGPDGVHGLAICEGDHVKRPGSVVYVDTAAFAVSGAVTVDMFPDGAVYLPAMP
jgi:DNA-binding beta-propeller fold protein YncE